MQLPDDLASPLEARDFDALEEAWLERLEAQPDDAAVFAATARRLAADGEEERARSLLELAATELAARGLWRARLDLLRRAGAVLLEPDRRHPEIVGTLEKLHGDRPSFAELAEHVGLHRATHDLSKTWDKVERLEQLLARDVGTVVAMDGRGVGRVVEANIQLSSFKVDFSGHAPLNVGFRAAPKMLEPLPPGHLLRRKLEEPEALRELAKSDPPGLLRIVLESRGRPLTAGEIRADLSGVVSEAAWSSFWAAARKHPQVVVGGKGRQTYAWAASSGHAVEAVWESFARADPRKQIELLRREADREPALAGRMADTLAAAARKAVATDPGLAFEIAAALERVGRASQAPEDAPERLVEGSRSRVDVLLSGIADRQLRERALELVRRDRDDWRAVFLDRLGREEDPRVLDAMADALAGEGDEETARALSRFLDGAVAQPHRHPAAFAWLAERAGRDEALRRRSPQRLFQQILGAGHRDELAPYRLRLRALAETGGTLPRLLPDLTEDQAAAAADAVHRSALLEDYQREALARAVELRFPSLTAAADAASETIYALPASIAAKRAELDHIARVELPANRKAIEEARAMGDLRENFEYKSARQRHEVLSAMATQLSRDLGRVRPLDLDQVDTSEVRVGTRVTLAGAAGERTFTVLGPWESDPERGVISYESDLGKSLLGKAVGDEVAVEGAPARVAGIAVAEA
ncbi:MAG TPA: GreA/GreB family elongation factor [Thermoanaerobaculia bacterium]|nr:GreA/GreB family elongation factor [Thermoanaerobaculia bacterium]